MCVLLMANAFTAVCKFNVVTCHSEILLLFLLGLDVTVMTRSERDFVAK